MLRNLLVAATLLLSFQGAKAEDISVVEKKVPVGSYAECTFPVPAGASVIWNVSPEPVKTTEYDSTLLFNGLPGTYNVTAILVSVKDGKVTTKKYKTTLVIDGTAPIPPPPVVPPTPLDAFTQAIQTAAATDRDPVNTAKLASLYRVAGTTTLNDPKIVTYGDLFDTMKAASLNLLPATAIPATRKVVGDRLNAIGSAASSPIDKPRLAAEFKAVADALSTVK